MATLASLAVKLGLDPKQFSSGLAAARKSLQSFSDLSRSGLDQVSVASDRAASGLRTFGKAMAISSTLASTTVGVHALAGAAVGLGAAVVAASGSLLLLPGAGLAAAAAFGALKIATSGFSDALAAMGDPEKFAEALKTLSPAAQEAAKAIAGLKPAFDELRASLQDKFFAGLAPQITELGNALMTSLRPAFESVASSANTAISSVLTDMASVQSQLQIGLIADNAATAFGNLSGALQPVLAALLDIGTVGASFLPGLTAGATSAAQGFAAMIARMRESGELATIIQGGLDALSQLGQLLANVGSIIGSVFGAMNATGGGALNILVQLTGEARAFFESARGQEVLTTVFSTLRDLVQALLPGVRAMGGALVDVITSVAPALPGLGEAFSAAAQSVAPLVSGLGQLAGTVLPPLISAIGFLAPALGPLAAFIGAIVAAVKAWSIAQAILNVALTANPIGIIIVALGALVAVLALAWHHSETFRNLVTGAWEAIKNAVTAAVSWVINFVQSNWPLLLGIIGGPIGAAVALVITNWDAIKAATGAAWDWVTGKISAAWDWIKGIVTGAAGAVVDFLRGAWERAKSMASSAWQAIVDAVRSGADRLMDLVGSIPGRILSALSGLASSLWQAGKNAIQSLIDGIMSMVGAVGRAIGNVASKIRNALPFSPAKEGPLSGRGSPDLAGQKIAQMLAEGMLAKLGAVASAAHQLAGMASVASAVGTLSDRGRAAQELLDHITRGGGVFEDMSFKGMSSLMGVHNDALADAFQGRTVEELRAWLPGYIESQRSAPVVNLRADDALIAALLAQLRNALRDRGLGGVLG